MKTLEILEKARELISVQSRWTQGAIARDKEGNACDFDSPDAVCWCSIGAIEKIGVEYGSRSYEEADYALRGTAYHHFKKSVLQLNDNDSYASVMELWDKAIEVAKENAK